MKTLKTLGGGLGVAALALVSTIAQAEVSASLGVASEYVFRGVPSSGGGAAVSGSLDWSNDKYYVGTWTSTASGPAPLGGGTTSGNEVDVYLGMTSGKLDIGGIAYVFPGTGGIRTSKLGEVYVGYNEERFNVYAWYGLASDWNDFDDDYVYLEGNVTAPVNARVDVNLHLGAALGVGDTARDGTDLYDLGVTLNVGGFWMGVTSQIADGSDTGPNKYPRVNVGYNWNFDNLPIFTRF